MRTNSLFSKNQFPVLRFQIPCSEVADLDAKRARSRENARRTEPKVGGKIRETTLKQGNQGQSAHPFALRRAPISLYLAVQTRPLVKPAAIGLLAGGKKLLRLVEGAGFASGRAE